jgi:hypothetical protein
MKTVKANDFMRTKLIITWLAAILKPDLFLTFSGQRLP